MGMGMRTHQGKELHFRIQEKLVEWTSFHSSTLVCPIQQLYSSAIVLYCEHKHNKGAEDACSSGSGHSLACIRHWVWSHHTDKNPIHCLQSFPRLQLPVDLSLYIIVLTGLNPAFGDGPFIQWFHSSNFFSVVSVMLPTVIPKCQLEHS